jgi:hypothetical protein
MAILIGLVVAIAAVLLVLDPILRPARAVAPSPLEPEDDPKEQKKELALAALKEIEFDRATGKLSDGDYQNMLARYTKEAVEALREADRPLERAPAAGGNGHGAVAGAGAGATAGDDPVERLIAEARQANKGRRFCTNCGSVLEGSGRFCVECGARI